MLDADATNCVVMEPEARRHEATRRVEKGEGRKQGKEALLWVIKIGSLTDERVVMLDSFLEAPAQEVSIDLKAEIEG